jgi:transcriptional regulator with PAS, ATPase and Fis domain
MADTAADTITARNLNLPRARQGELNPGAQSLEEAERVFIEKVLARHDGDVRLAAQQLGISRSALYRRLQQHGIRE